EIFNKKSRMYSKLINAKAEIESVFRSRRSLAADVRQFELSEDLYQVRSKERVHLSDQIPLEIVENSAEKLTESTNFLHDMKVPKNAHRDEQVVVIKCTTIAKRARFPRREYTTLFPSASPKI